MAECLFVDLNKLVKIRFFKGDELLLRIFSDVPLVQLDEFPLNKEAPLGKALLGHTEGDQIEYKVANKTYKVTILEIHNN